MQSAYNRDKYVKIHRENIPNWAQNNFFKYSNNDESFFGETYDYNSLMHYEAYEFSLNGQPTIEPIVSTNLLLRSDKIHVFTF